MLLVDEYRHIGERVPLGLARNAADELLANRWDGEGDLPEPPDGPSAADNDAALADLMTQIGAFGG